MRALILLACLLVSGCTNAVTWDMVNVNSTNRQGDAHLWLDRDVVLIDAGQLLDARSHLVPHLRRRNIRRIDYFVISHPHCDHYCGIEAVVDAGIQIGAVIYNEPPANLRDCCFLPEHWANFKRTMAQRNIPMIDVSKGYKFETGVTRWEVLSALKDTSMGDLNDMSLVLQAKVGKNRTLFTGDLNHRHGTRLAANKRNQIAADILKVPHHGATGIAPLEFFETVNPQLLMFPAPRWISWDARGKLAFGFAAERDYCYNGYHGTVTIKYDLDGFWLERADRWGQNCNRKRYEAAGHRDTVKPAALNAALLPLWED